MPFVLCWKIEDYADGFDLLWNSVKYECLYTSPNGDSLSLEVSFPNYNMYDDWSYNFVKIVKVPGRSHIWLILTSNISRVPIITRILKSGLNFACVWLFFKACSVWTNQPRCWFLGLCDHIFFHANFLDWAINVSS